MSTNKPCRRPCATCPWRGKVRNDPAFAKIETSADGETIKWYSLKNLRRLWRGLRDGTHMSCHATDENNPRPDGWKPIPKDTEMKVCIGAVILMQREVMRFQEACESSPKKQGLKIYRQQHPKGISRDGMTVLADELIFGGPLREERPDLNEEDISHPDLVPWETKQPTAQEA